jgi:prepilin-type N-terminal cleavage/methylation domain-containing protein
LNRIREILRKAHKDKGGFTLIELLVVIAILGILVAIVILNILGLMNEGEEEARSTEYHNIQTAVYAMMVKAEVSYLDGSSDYDEIYTLDDVQEVTAAGATYSLDEFLMGGQYPLKQAYDITLNGLVTVD